MTALLECYQQTWLVGLFSYSVLSYVMNTVMTTLLEYHQYTLIVLLQCIAMLYHYINPNCYGKPIKLLETHPVNAEISDHSYRCLANWVKVMYIGTNKLNASASDHKPLHAYIQNSTGSCLYMHIHHTT